MKLYQLLLHTEIQSDYKVVIYDYVREERIQVDVEDYAERDVRYLYVEDGILYIEIEFEE